MTHGPACVPRTTDSASSAVFSDSLFNSWLTCLNPRYITRISCLENFVCRSSSSRATGLVVCCLARALSKSNRASSGPGESGGVAISLSNQPDVFFLSPTFPPLGLLSLPFFFCPPSWLVRGHTTFTSFLPVIFFFFFFLP